MERIRSAEYLRSAHTPAELLRDDRPQVAFVGRSNVGKSSLLNVLVGQKRLARISSTPGRTQSINYFLINRNLHFVDLPGYGYAKTSQKKRQQWADLIDAYFEAARPRAEAVLLVDAKVAGTPSDAEAFEYLVHKGARPIVVATKIDKVPRSRRSRQLKELRQRVGLPPGEPLIEVSAQTGEGVKQLWGEILSRL